MLTQQNYTTPHKTFKSAVNAKHDKKKYSGAAMPRIVKSGRQNPTVCNPLNTEWVKGTGVRARRTYVTIMSEREIGTVCWRSSRWDKGLSGVWCAFEQFFLLEYFCDSFLWQVQVACKLRIWRVLKFWTRILCKLVLDIIFVSYLTENFSLSSCLAVWLSNLSDSNTESSSYIRISKVYYYIR